VFAPDYRTGLSRISADGGEVRPLTTLKSSEASHIHPLLKAPESEIFPDDWSRDGRRILFERLDGLRQADLWAMPAPLLRADGTLAPADKPFPVLTSPFTESQGRFSPDGK
jgi:hypothetical protein